MAPLDGDERSETPSLSWNSVVQPPTAAPATPERPGDVEPVAPSPIPQPAADDPAVPSPTLNPAVPQFQTPALPTINSIPTVAPASVPTTEPPAPHSTPAVPAVSLAELIAPGPPPQVPVVEPAEPVTPTFQPTAPVVGSDASVGTTSVERVVEPEPVAASVEAVPQVEAPVAPVVPAPAPQPEVPSLPTNAAAQPSQRAARAATPVKSRKPRKDRSGSVAKVGFFFLIVGAIASAAIIFGRPYLFPADWEQNALEFAEPIERARGVDFIEPVLLTAQPSAVHQEMVAAQLLGDPASSLPMWRALGLAGPDSTDDQTLNTLISDHAPVLYSTVDGQVYYDTAFTRSDRSTLISRAMATAALDQELTFSADAASRSLDDAALTEAHVRQQAAIIAENATNRGSVQAADVAALAFLPSVLDYQLTAPIVFVELLAPVNEVAPNPLSGVGVSGPGPLRIAPLEQIPSNSSVVGDAAVGASIVTDRSFWYMSFASHLDAGTAYRMSNDLQSAGLQMVDGQNGRCAVATFNTFAGNPALQSDLETWVAATAPELGATVTTLPDASIQLRSCDPVGAYVSNIGFGASRQLIAWRSIELAVTNLVIADGGAAPEIAAAVARIGSSPAALAAAELPAGTTPADLIAAVEAAAADVIAAGSLPADPAGEG